MIATIEKNSIEEVRVSLSEYQGFDLVGVRIWGNYDSPTSEKRPTKKGVALKVERLPELIAALQQAQAEAESAGLLEVATATAPEAREPELPILAAG